MRRRSLNRHQFPNAFVLEHQTDRSKGMTEMTSMKTNSEVLLDDCRMMVDELPIIRINGY